MFEKIVETINSTGKAVGEKTRHGTDIVRTNLKITTEERELSDLYMEIGKLYYKNNLDNPCCDDMKELFDKVGEKQASIEELKAKVRDLKGVAVCQNCGAEVDNDNTFCGKCGAKIERPEKAAIEVDDVNEVIDHEDTVETDISESSEE